MNIYMFVAYLTFKFIEDFLPRILPIYLLSLFRQVAIFIEQPFHEGLLFGLRHIARRTSELFGNLLLRDPEAKERNNIF